MASLFRLKGRALQIGNLSLFFLIFLTAVMLILTVNLLPVIYIRGAESYVQEYLGEYTAFVNFAYAVFAFISVFSVFSGINLGTKRFFLKKAQKRKPTAQDIFYYFKPKNFFRCIFYSFRISSVRLLTLAFFLLPGGICLFTVYKFSLSGVSALVCLALFITAVCLLINGIVFYTSFVSSFFLCDYCFIEGSYVSFSNLIASSQKMMSDKKSVLKKLKLSFTGWFLLCIFIVPLPFVWSYYSQSLAVAAEDFMKGKK